MNSTDRHARASAIPDRAMLLRAARGFSATFWGLVVTILILAGIVSVHPLLLYRLPAYVVCTAFLLLAAVWFVRAGKLSARWRGFARQYLMAACLQLYMIPYIGWWRTVQHPVYQSVNMLLLIAGVAWLLILVHLLALEVARLLQDPVLLLETRICLWACPLLGAAAIGLFALASVLTGSAYQGNIVWLLRAEPLWIRPWSGLPVALPFTVALAVAWEAKERCLAHLQSGGPSPKVGAVTERT